MIRLVVETPRFKAACAAAAFCGLFLLGGCGTTAPTASLTTGPAFGVAYNATTNLIYTIGDAIQ